MLKVTMLQTTLHWEDVGANLAMLEEKIWNIDEKTDIIVLPEMFNTGFTMNSKEMSEPMNGRSFRWMKQMAAQCNAAITGSIIISEKKAFYNRLIWMEPDGKYQFYDKRHLFRMTKENEFFSEGLKKLVVNWRGWKIAPMICYDLRFPVWSRNINLGYDLLIFVANWPSPRINAWSTLLQARAIENMSYSIGINRIGFDNNDFEYTGQSAAYDFKGIEIESCRNEEVAKTVSLTLQPLLDFRNKFPCHLDGDHFQIK